MAASPVTGDTSWILVLDVGSSSVRVWFYDREGRGVDPGPDAQQEYGWRARPAGAMEYDADRLLRSVAVAVDAALAHAREARMQVAAVGIAAFWHSVMGIDTAGAPLTPVYAWGDTRAAETAIRLRESVDEEALHQRTGCFLHPSYPSVKLAWLRERDPTGFAAVAAWISFPEYLEQQLFGQRRCSFSMAAGSGLLDVHRLEWDPEALAIAGVQPRHLSPLVDSDAPLRGLRPEFAERWPELAGLDWFPALGDGACANLGSGALGAERIGLTIGTSAAIRSLWEPAGEVRLPTGLWCYRLDRRWWVAGSALSNGGNAIAYLRGLLDLPGEREWEARLEWMEPDAHGLTVLPYLVGERGPGWLRQTRAAVLGWTQTTPPEHLLRAWMEAIAYGIARVSQQLERALGTEPLVLASGGAVHASPVWAQILADVMDRTVVLPVEHEATSRGAALVVQERLGWIPDLRAPRTREAQRFEPDPARHRRYRAAMDRQAAVEAALAPWLAISPEAGAADD